MESKLALQPRDIPVVILCGGAGTRLREVNEKLPKPLVEVGGRPILWHIMRLYSHYGFRRFILCLGYKGHLIKRYFLDYRHAIADFTLRFGEADQFDHHDEVALVEDWEVSFVETGLNTATGARIRRVGSHLDQDTFMVTYGDGLGDVNLTQLLEAHRAGGRTATVTGVHPPSRFGEMHIEGDAVVDFREKPTLATTWVNGGFFVFQRDFLDLYLDDDPELVLEQGPLSELARQSQLSLHRHDGYWQGMDTIREWSELNELWQSGKAPWKVWGDR